jgi:outer membrane protein OmpA-like peptidoglycan-associated protein
MAQNVKYYTGTFHAQFETGKTTPVYAHMNSAEIELIPRFMLEHAIEIDSKAYEQATLNPPQPYLQRKLNESIELLFVVGSAKRVSLREVTLQWTTAEVRNQGFWTFIAEKNGRRHGRFKATGFVAVIEMESEVVSSIATNDAEPARVPIDTETTHVDTSLASTPTVSASPTPPLSSRGGWSPLSGLGLRMPGGCGLRGCGFLAIFPLLLVLLGLLRQCQGNNNQQSDNGRNGGREDAQGGNRQSEGNRSGDGQNGNGQNGSGQDGSTRDGATVIYDTVYVERVKERVDTLRLFLTDTVEMIESSKQTIFKPVVLPNVQFYTNSANLIPTSLSDIQQLAQHLIDTPQLDAVVIGHTDNVGDKQSNLKLSRRRAETVRNVIISMGVEANRIKAVGKGDNEPKTDNNSEEGRLMNRRVEVQLVQSVIEENKKTRKK